MSDSGVGPSGMTYVKSAAIGGIMGYVFYLIARIVDFGMLPEGPATAALGAALAAIFAPIIMSYISGSGMY